MTFAFFGLSLTRMPPGAIRQLRLAPVLREIAAGTTRNMHKTRADAKWKAELCAAKCACTLRSTHQVNDL
jgi:hypothetical protein